MPFISRHVCVLAVCASLFVGSVSVVRAATYNVDPVAGNDSNAGSASRPWKTLAASFPRLRAGDVLNLRGGTYFERNLVIAARGESSAPITIRSASGEQAVIDGGYTEFREAPNLLWQPVDPLVGLYRSVNAYPGPVSGFVKHQGAIYKLVDYDTLDDLRTTNQFFVEAGPIYVGHGLYWNPFDRRIYIRLVPSDLQLSLGHSNPPALDPNQTRLLLFSDGVLLRFDAAARYVRLEGVDLVDQGNAIEFSTGAHHIQVRDAQIRAGRSHVLVRGGTHHLLFDGLDIDGHVPPWITWQDVKVNTDPADSFATSAVLIRDDAYQVEIRNCRIRDAWDAITAVDHSHGLSIHHNEFRGVRDDVAQLGSGGYDYEIHHNAMIRVSKGVSRHGSGDSPKPGSTWVHHNVIDTSQMMQYGRERSPGVWPKECDSGMQGKVWARPFGTHTGSGFGNGDAWRIYHNTLVFGKDLNLYGAGHTVSSRPGYRHEVLNNIFVQIGDHAVARQATSVGGYQVYDGNLYHQRSASSSTPLFRNYVSDSSTDLALLAQEKFGCSKGQPCWDATCAQVDVNGDGRVGTEDIVALFRSPASEQKTSFMSLAEFLRSPFHQGTRAFYAQGWEANSVEADPKLDSQYAPSASGPGASGAVPLPAGYRGDQSERHRGALAPGHTLSEVGPYP